MGLPNVTVLFKERGITAIKRSERGIVALILKNGEVRVNTFKANEKTCTDEKEIKSTQSNIKVHKLLTVADIPMELSAFNREQVELALLGYQTPPKRVFLIVIPHDSENYNEAFKTLEGIRFDYLVIPDIKTAEISTVASWVKSQNETMDKKFKVVLPNCKGDHESIINFTSDNIITSTKTYSTSEYCSRIAGMLAGTPLTISATYAPLPEVLDFDKLTKDEMDQAIEKGELILYNDGEKVKIARAVNSFVTTIQDKGESFKKIKIVDAMHMIHDDIKKTAEDSYLGKYSNSYDNKCLLITAINGYLEQLELDGILNNSYDNKVYINVEQQRVFLKSIGYDGMTEDEIEAMDELAIKKADTRDKVFLAGNIKILDAIEDIDIPITI